MPASPQYEEEPDTFERDPRDDKLKAPVWRGRRCDDPDLNPGVASFMRTILGRERTS